MGHCTMKKYLVTWKDYPFEDAQWIPETNWWDPKMLKTYLKEDRLTGKKSKPGKSRDTP